MLTHVILLHPKFSRYHAFQLFLEQLAAAYRRRGTRVSSFDLARLDTQELMRVLREESPDATLCFNGVLPEPAARSLTDITCLPHLCWLVDPPTRLSAMAYEPHTALACVDRHSCAVFDQLGALETLFLPHAAAPDLTPAEKEIDILLPGTFIDPSRLYQSWQDSHGPTLATWMRELAQQIHDDASRAPYQHLAEACSLSTPELFRESWHGVALVDLWHSMEFYIRGLERCHLLTQLSDFTVHITGEGWEDYLAAQPHANIHYHGPLSYEHNLEWLRRARVVINSNPLFRDGSHDRLFNGLAAACTVLTNHSPYVTAAFPPGHGVLTYPHPLDTDIPERIAIALSGAQEAEVAAGRDLVMGQHLWDHRLAAIDAAVESCRRLL